MKNYMMISPECLVKLSNCFSSPEEVATFLNHTADLVEELLFQGQLAKRVDEESNVTIVMKQICILTIFFREHMELIHQLIANLEYKPISEEEMKKMKEEKK